MWRIGYAISHGLNSTLNLFSQGATSENYDYNGLLSPTGIWHQNQIKDFLNFLKLANKARLISQRNLQCYNFFIISWYILISFYYFIIYYLLFYNSFLGRSRFSKPRWNFVQVVSDAMVDHVLRSLIWDIDSSSFIWRGLKGSAEGRTVSRPDFYTKMTLY